LYAILSAGCSIRYASGMVDEYRFSEGLLNETMAEELNISMVAFIFKLLNSIFTTIFNI
jgi:hypothetical protein